MIDFGSALGQTTDAMVLFPQVAETQATIHAAGGNQVGGYGVVSGHVVVNDEDNLLVWSAA